MFVYSPGHGRHVGRPAGSAAGVRVSIGEHRGQAHGTLPGGLSGIEKASTGSRYCLGVLFLRGEKAVADVFGREVGHREKCVGGYPKANE
jgi:hypothetical protein